MSNYFGLLQIPAVAPATDADPLGDPLLKVLLDFQKAVLNYDATVAWASRAPTDPVPVVGTFARNPNRADLDSQDLPALYAWRGTEDRGVARFSQGLISDEAPVMCLWVPPTIDTDLANLREPMANVVKKSLRMAFAAGRHPGWVVPGDTYYNPARYGSVLLVQTKLARIRVGRFASQKLLIEVSEDGKQTQEYDALTWTLELLELSGDNRALAYAQVTNKGRLLLDPAGRDATAPFVAAQYDFQITVDGVSPITGPAAGGTVVTLSGKQFYAEMTVFFAGTAATELQVVDERTATLKTPAHAAGLVDILVRAPGAADVLVPAAFTYT